MKPTKNELTRYLKSHLIDILSLGSSGSPSIVWLSKDDFGQIRHSASAQDDGVGGLSVPELAVQEGKIFKPKLNEVVAFLKGFGLSQADAEDVAYDIGVFTPTAKKI